MESAGGSPNLHDVKTAGPHEAASPLRGVGRLWERLRPARAARSDPEQRYRNLFECVSDGFALVEIVRGPEGRVADYVVLDANPALVGLLRMDRSPVGLRFSQLFDVTPPGWLAACGRAMDGEPVGFEYQAPRSGRWFEIHMSRISETHLAQLVVEVTERKKAEHRQSEVFDELNHRVKNNLAMVSAMLALQARAAELPQVREQLQRAIDRIQTIADVHATLYRTGRKDDVDFGVYLGSLCDRLRKSVLDSDRVDLRLQADPAVLDLDKAAALGVVVNELVTNAAKHAYPPPAHGSISVKLAQTAGGLELTIGDAGPGLPEMPPTGLGMRLVRSLVQQIGARLEIVRQPGATFHIRLPHNARSAPPRQASLL